MQVLHTFSAAVATFVSLTTAAAADTTIKIDKTFVTSDVTWSSSLGKVFVHWKPTVIDGKPYICGAVSNENSRMSQHNRDLLRAGYILVDDKKVLRNLNHFAILRIGTEVQGAAANCAVIPGQVTSKSRISLGMNSIRVRN